MAPTTLDRTRCAELLAAAPATDVVAAAEAALAGTDDPILLRGPEVGSLVMTVREPVERTRFQLGDVLVTQVEIEHRGTRGWAMRPGSDTIAALAAAVCDAELAAAGPATDQIVELCERTEQDLVSERNREWAELEPTIVNFEEMD